MRLPPEGKLHPMWQLQPEPAVLTGAWLRAGKRQLRRSCAQNSRLQSLPERDGGSLQISSAPSLKLTRSFSAISSGTRVFTRHPGTIPSISIFPLGTGGSKMNPAQSPTSPCKSSRNMTTFCRNDVLHFKVHPLIN